MRFPRLPGTTLDGYRLSLPGDLAGNPTLVLLSFRWQHRTVVDPWCSLARRLAERYDGFDFNELLLVDPRSRMFRPAGGRGLRFDLVTDQRHDRMVVVRVDKRRLRQTLGLLGEESTYALLLDANHVVRQAAGVLTEDTATAVKSLVGEWERARADRSCPEETESSPKSAHSTTSSTG